jgi:hypothetical protein
MHPTRQLWPSSSRRSPRSVLLKNDVDDDDDNDGLADALDTDADGDEIEDAVAIKLSLRRLPGLGLPDLR